MFMSKSTFSKSLFSLGKKSGIGDEINPDLQNILTDLVIYKTVDASRKLATTIHSELSKNLVKRKELIDRYKSVLARYKEKLEEEKEKKLNNDKKS